MKIRQRLCTVVLIALWVASASSGAQEKRPVPPGDFAQWETLVAQPRATTTGPLSPDGRWLVYGISRQNRNNELRVVNVASGNATTLALAESPAFSADSKWLVYAIGVSEAEEEKLQRDRKPVRRKAGILDLATGKSQVVDNIESFALSADGHFVALRAYAPEPARAERPADDSGSSEERDRPGSALVVRRLASGADTTFGNVTEFAWQSKGPFLAFVVGIDGRVGNGVQLYNPSTGSLRVLDSAEAAYNGLVWRKDADDLAVLRSKSNPGREGSTHVVLAWQQLAGAAPAAHLLDPTGGALPADQRIVSSRRPEWSRDGQRLFVGVAAWEAKPESAKDDKGAKSGGPAPNPDDIANVDVWHWRDVDVIPLQKRRLPQDRQRSLLAAWTPASQTFVTLARTHMDDVRLLDVQPRALVIEREPYGMQRSIGRQAADLAIVDLMTGARTRVKDRVEDRWVQASPDGRYVLYLLDDHYWVYDIGKGTHTNLTKSIATSFIDRQSDETVKQKPAYGTAGWTTDAAGVWLYDRYDIWEIAPDGSRAVRLTDGAASRLRHRYTRIDPDDRFIDRTRPVYMSLFGEWSKQSGYARLEPGADKAARLTLLDKRVTSLARAKDADVYAYMVLAFDDSPDYHVGGAMLADARVVTATNPFHDKYAWGRAELIEYKSLRGERLQGVLHYPAGYVAGKQYPMVVYMYEKLSDGLHSYASPSERAPYNAAVFTSRGYFYFQPDIVFRPREPGVSVVECVTPAVKTVVAKGAVDPARIGIIGHSWGGFDTAYLATHTTLFAAGVAGAPITNLVSNYGSHHWSSGIAETDHIETGQQRMEVPLYEDLPAYIRNSAVFNVHAMKTPLLVAFGDNDGTVHWHQGVEMYNIARRAGTPLVMLAYANEDHGLRRRANQLDYQRRIFAWFDHYLQGAPPASWITNGVSALDREKEVKGKK